MYIDKSLDYDTHNNIYINVWMREEPDQRGTVS